MSTTKRVLNPERLRQVPEHFSWLDHRLVREHTIEKADVCAWALYLFLVTVADAHGLSYYSEATVSYTHLDVYKRQATKCCRSSLLSALAGVGRAASGRWSAFTSPWTSVQRR